MTRLWAPAIQLPKLLATSRTENGIHGILVNILEVCSYSQKTPPGFSLDQPSRTSHTASRCVSQPQTHCPAPGFCNRRLLGPPAVPACYPFSPSLWPSQKMGPICLRFYHLFCESPSLFVAYGFRKGVSLERLEKRN